MISLDFWEVDYIFQMATDILHDRRTPEEFSFKLVARMIN